MVLYQLNLKEILRVTASALPFLPKGITVRIRKSKGYRQAVFPGSPFAKKKGGGGEPALRTTILQYFLQQANKEIS